MKLHVLHKARRIDAIARSDGWATIDPAGVESQGVGSGDEGGVGAPGCQSHGAASGHLFGGAFEGGNAWGENIVDTMRVCGQHYNTMGVWTPR